MKATKVTEFGIQRKIVANMTSESWETIPHISYIYEPEISKFLDVVKELNASGKFPVKITINTIMLKALSEAFKAAPRLNAHIKFNRKLVRGTITEFDEIHASMTWVLPNGEMMTINLHDIGNKSLVELTEYIADVGRRIGNTDLTEVMFSVSLQDTLEKLKKGKLMNAIYRLIGSKTGKNKVKTLSGQAKKDYYAIPEKDRLTKEDIKQGTVTISNIGSVTRNIPGRVAMLSIIPPQIFVCCMGSIIKKPVVKQDENGNDIIAIGNELPIDLVFDHRAVDFGDLVPFIQRLEDIFKNPEQMYNW
ncbi:MAG: 2-oxo acid dehydrogenase subunit E2 [Oscillospiraceae bacterium]|nr:2-oxo acid dehydrogenase subunit E2 [Clostridiaceae bacterium]MDY5948411.1 2-oxo acid dehydrogenase subunit E2 [Oscillospiraceae bacterium]